MTVLVRFQNNLFDTKNISDKSFDDIYDSAISDVNPAEFEKKSKISKIELFFYNSKIYGYPSFYLFHSYCFLCKTTGDNSKYKSNFVL